MVLGTLLLSLVLNVSYSILNYVFYVPLGLYGLTVGIKVIRVLTV